MKSIYKNLFKYNFKILNVLVILSIILIFSTNFKNVSHAESSNNNKLQKGIIIDIARKDYDKTSIKKIIDDVSNYNGQYVQLHFSDNENYAIESQYLKNHKYNLSKNDIKDLANYANDKNIMLVPDFDIPGHSKYFIDHVKIKNSSIKTDYDNSTIDFYNNKYANDITDRQIKEIAQLFNQQNIKNQRFHIGCDEVSGSHSHQKDFITFINHKQNVLKNLGYQTSIWNDGITNKNLDQLNKDITILYWQQNKAATPKELNDAGFNLYNCNFYTFAFMPHSKITKSLLQEQSQYILNHNIYQFNTDVNPYRQYNINLSGIGYTYWSEKSKDSKTNDLLLQIYYLNHTFFSLNIINAY